MPLVYISVQADLQRVVSLQVAVVAIAIVFPITAFVAAGFEHSIANMYLMPLAMLLGAPLGAADILRKLVPVIAGNLVGGSVLVALVSHVIYVRGGRVGPEADSQGEGALR